MIEQSITINGIKATLTATSAVTWTASSIDLRLRPNLTWRATRGELAGCGDTAQAAIDDLLAAERKSEKAAKLAARSTKGQNFAREMRTHLHIGARTRRYRKGSDLHAQILESITSAAWHEGSHDAARQETFRTALGAWMSYEKHIAGYRADCKVISHIKGLTPYQFCALLGDMIDAGISNVGEGERFFAQLRTELYAQAA
ncbi:hypothetical protein ACF061_00460 [Streptomyces sp. NPDC015220]|uniref:hypothetical protein n=1 Tax=Streptomyces sp. NPDC015220 TaxID=3364947 RepID=UPI0036FF4C8B